MVIFSRIVMVGNLLRGEGVKLVAAHGDLLVQSLHARPATRSTGEALLLLLLLFMMMLMMV